MKRQRRAAVVLALTVLVGCVQRPPPQSPLEIEGELAVYGVQLAQRLQDAQVILDRLIDQFPPYRETALRLIEGTVEAGRHLETLARALEVLDRARQPIERTVGADQARSALSGVLAALAAQGDPAQPEAQRRADAALAPVLGLLEALERRLAREPSLDPVPT